MPIEQRDLQVTVDPAKQQLPVLASQESRSHDASPTEQPAMEQAKQ